MYVHGTDITCHPVRSEISAARWKWHCCNATKCLHSLTVTAGPYGFIHSKQQVYFTDCTYVSFKLVSNGHTNCVCGIVSVCFCSVPLVSVRLWRRFIKPRDKWKVFAQVETFSTRMDTSLHQFVSNCVFPLTLKFDNYLIYLGLVLMYEYLLAIGF